jgi:hypothetical protein
MQIQVDKPMPRQECSRVTSIGVWLFAAWLAVVCSSYLYYMVRSFL